MSHIPQKSWLFHSLKGQPEQMEILHIVALMELNGQDVNLSKML